MVPQIFGNPHMVKGYSRTILLMDEILHHLGALNYYNSSDCRDLRWCKIFLHQQYDVVPAEAWPGCRLWCFFRTPKTGPHWRVLVGFREGVGRRAEHAGLGGQRLATEGVHVV